MKKQWILNHHEGKAIDQIFFEHYDSNFVLSKCLVLDQIVKNFSEAKDFFDPFELTFEEKDKDRFRAEIYFSEFHQFEALFALLLAPFQKEAHCIYLSQYKVRDLKSKIQQYLKEDIKSITSGKLDSYIDFLDKSIYSGIRSSSLSEEVRRASFKNINSIIKKLARKYLSATEYNYYKHSLRMFPIGGYVLTLSLTEADTPFATWESDASIRFFDIQGTDNKESVLTDVIRLFDPGESMTHLSLMQKILSTIRETRLAGYLGTSEVNITLFNEFDTSLLKYSHKDIRLAVTVGKFM